MTRTYRIWNKSKYSNRWLEYDERWKLNTMSVFGYHKEKKIRKSIRHSIRCINRTKFRHNIYEPILEINGEYFD